MRQTGDLRFETLYLQVAKWCTERTLRVWSLIQQGEKLSLQIVQGVVYGGGEVTSTQIP